MPTTETVEEAGTVGEIQAAENSGQATESGLCDPSTRIYIRHPETNEAYVLEGVRAEIVWQKREAMGFERFDTEDAVMDAVDAGPDEEFYDEEEEFDPEIETDVDHGNSPEFDY